MLTRLVSTLKTQVNELTLSNECLKHDLKHPLGVQPFGITLEGGF
jgi:hypothetical protein